MLTYRMGSLFQATPHQTVRALWHTAYPYVSMKYLAKSSITVRSIGLLTIFFLLESVFHGYSFFSFNL